MPVVARQAAKFVSIVQVCSFRRRILFFKVSLSGRAQAHKLASVLNFGPNDGDLISSNSSLFSVVMLLILLQAP